MIVGVDPSLTATGIAMRLDDGTEPARPACITSRARGPLRLIEIRDLLRDIIPTTATVYIEGYSYASRHKAHQLGELGGVIRVDLWERGIRCIEVSPATLKKWAVGVGNAGKDQMLAAAIRAGYEGHDNNQADAWHLADLGHHAEHPEIFVTKPRRKILDTLGGVSA